MSIIVHLTPPLNRSPSFIFSNMLNHIFIYLDITHRFNNIQYIFLHFERDFFMIKYLDDMIRSWRLHVSAGESANELTPCGANLTGQEREASLCPLSL